MSSSTSQPEGLSALEARLQQDLAWLALPPQPWVAGNDNGTPHCHDVVIIGAGMAGMTAALALRLQGIEATLYDKAVQGTEGPWVTTAKMETLRSPKEVSGPAMGLPALTFRAWFEAQYGTAAWEALDKIPREQWMDYLRWYRQVLALNVHNEHELVALIPHQHDRCELHINHHGQVEVIKARRVILALGMGAFGGPSLPDFIQELPSRYWAHTEDKPDYDALKGKRVAVVGASAAAMDAAATALERQAAGVELLIRRTDFPRFNRTKGAANPGFEQGYYKLPDHWKWRLAHQLASEQIAPPHGSTLRVSRHANAWFNFGCSIQQVEVQDNDSLRVLTSKGAFPVDYLILATGYQLDWHARTGFEALVPHIKTWADVYTPHASLNHQQLARCPYLNADFSFQARSAEMSKSLEHIYCFSFPAQLSNGHTIGLIPGISQGARKLTDALVGSLYVEDQRQQYDSIMRYAKPELIGDEWHPAAPYDQR